MTNNIFLKILIINEHALKGWEHFIIGCITSTFHLPIIGKYVLHIILYNTYNICNNNIIYACKRAMIYYYLL